MLAKLLLENIPERKIGPPLVSDHDILERGENRERDLLVESV